MKKITLFLASLVVITPMLTFASTMPTLSISGTDLVASGGSGTATFNRIYGADGSFVSTVGNGFDSNAWTKSNIVASYSLTNQKYTIYDNPNCGGTFVYADCVSGGYATRDFWVNSGALSLTAPVVGHLRNSGVQITGGTTSHSGTFPATLDGSALQAGVSGAVGNSMDGIAPILAVVGGLILTFVMVKYFANTARKAGR